MPPPDLLPAVLHVPADPVAGRDIAAIVDLLAGEVGARDAGSRIAAARLIDLLLIAAGRGLAPRIARGPPAVLADCVVRPDHRACPGRCSTNVRTTPGRSRRWRRSPPLPLHSRRGVDRRAGDPRAGGGLLRRRRAATGRGARRAAGRRSAARWPRPRRAATLVACIQGGYVLAALATGEYRADGETVSLAIRTTRAFVFEPDVGWRQVHHHGSIDDPRLLARYQSAVADATGPGAPEPDGA